MNAVLQTAPKAAPARRILWTGWLPLAALPAAAILLRDRMPAWAFMWLLSFAIFASLKWMSWWSARGISPHSVGRSIAYLLAWPGMDAEAFLDGNFRAQRPNSRTWLWASIKTSFGILLLWAIARRVSAEYNLARGWMGLLGLIFLLHFGSFHLIALFWQAMGIEAEPIMAKPVLSKSLSEFWGKRWNLGFRQLAHEFVFRPLYKRVGGGAAGLLVFVASGLIHDLVISVPARGGYGLPTAYFVIQGLGVAAERSGVGRRLGLQSGAAARMFLVSTTALPAFWLFHPPFLHRVILPFMHVIHAL